MRRRCRATSPGGCCPIERRDQPSSDGKCDPKHPLKDHPNTGDAGGGVKGEEGGDQRGEKEKSKAVYLHSRRRDVVTPSSLDSLRVAR